MSRYFRKPNILTPLILVIGFALAFRLVNIMSFRGVPASDVGAARPAGAVEAVTETVKEEPPPLTQADAAKAAQDTAKSADALPAQGGSVVNTDAATPPADPVAPTQFFSTSEVEVLQSLSKRREELDAREKAISGREALLKAAEQEVDRKVAELNKLKGEMETLLGTQQKADDTRISSLVKIYENMKPKEAAAIFDQLDMDILLEVIGRMNERKVSPVLAGMNPQKAKDVTTRLAEQRKLPADKKSGQ